MEKLCLGMCHTFLVAKRIKHILHDAFLVMNESMSTVMSNTNILFICEAETFNL